MTALALPTPTAPAAVPHAYRDLPAAPRPTRYTEPVRGRGRPKTGESERIEAARVAHEEEHALRTLEHEARVQAILMARLRLPFYRASNRAWSFLADAYRATAGIGAPKAAPAREGKETVEKLENSDQGLKILALSYLDSAAHAFEVEGAKMPDDLAADIARLRDRIEEKLPTHPKEEDYALPAVTRTPTGTEGARSLKLVQFLASRGLTAPASIERVAAAYVVRRALAQSVQVAA